MEFGLLCEKGHVRTRAYLSALSEAGLSFGSVVDFDSRDLIMELSSCEEEYFVYAGSRILSSEIVNLKKIIHVHPGLLPYYKGSTCFYYSLLQEKVFYCTALILDASIDGGKIICSKKFEFDKSVDLDSFDTECRSKMLVFVLVNFEELRKGITEQKEEGDMYYVIHPVLRNIAVRLLRGCC